MNPILRLAEIFKRCTEVQVHRPVERSDSVVVTAQFMPGLADLDELRHVGARQISEHLAVLIAARIVESGATDPLRAMILDAISPAEIVAEVKARLATEAVRLLAGLAARADK